MSNLSAFLKKNKKTRENVFYAASRDFVDESGAPILWELKPVTTAENERIREECTHEVKGEKGQMRSKLDSNAYMARLAVSSIVFPNLYDAALQDSYGVKTPEALLKEMISVPGEYDELFKKVMQVSGFENSISEEIEEAKN